LIAVPLDAASKPPEPGVITYDEQTLTLTWPAAEGAAYFIYNGAETSNTPNVPLQTERLTAGKFTQPVTFGKRVCFVIRAVTGTSPVTIESPPSAEVCATPADTFPPPAPGGLIALASPGAISLTWDAVTAADLAGYIVLRGEGSGDRLQPLMAQPVTGTSFSDQTAKAGVRYFYAVVAVDKAAPPNRSKNSNVVEETGR
jgi:fibronectin type 3 domain-containing protein